jgi:hypothetical protein
MSNGGNGVSYGIGYQFGIADYVMVLSMYVRGVKQVTYLTSLCELVSFSYLRLGMWRIFQW